MTIALILSSLGAGGAERVIALLANHWVAKGRPVVVIAFDHDTDPVFHHFDPRVRMVRLGLPPAGRGRLTVAWRSLRRLFRLRAVLRDVAPDIVVSFLIKINVTTLIASAGLGIPVIVSERNHPARGNGNALWPKLRQRLYPHARAIVLQTEASRAVMPAALLPLCTVIANPITSFDRSSEPATGHILAAVGRLEQQKGFDLLLDAFATVAARHPDWTLMIWGEGPLRGALEAQRERLGLADRVALPGTSATPGGWISLASAFVLSSRFEGFGNAIGEALAAGLPVVAFNCEFGIDKLTEDGRAGLLVPAEDIAGLGAGIDRLLGDKALRDRLGNRAREMATRFSPESIFADWQVLLDATIDKTKGNPGLIHGNLGVLPFFRLLILTTTFIFVQHFGESI